MSNRQTGIGRLFRSNRDAAVKEIAEVLARYKGNLERSAFELGITRRQLYRILYREKLWHVVDQERDQVREQRQWLRNLYGRPRTRAV